MSNVIRLNFATKLSVENRKEEYEKNQNWYEDVKASGA